ncbi:MAG: ribbon-helix-helix protein, CopG family [Chloroflexi bacterium]|nr:ribbon-helix-helix protein, CopG family [Chloroflexota bacterium]
MRTQIQLSQEQAKRLKALATARKMSVPELIRQNLDRLIPASSALSSEERRRRAIAVAGRFRSGQSDLSINHDKYLAEAYQSARTA